MPRHVPCPSLDHRAVRRRLAAALRQEGPERRNIWGRRARSAAVLAAAAVALAGTALGVAAHLDVLDAFFRGDTAPVEDLVDRESRSISDKYFSFAVESSVSDGGTAYLVVRVDARTEGAAAALQGEAFFNMDTFIVCPVAGPDAPLSEDDQIGVPDAGSIRALMSHEMHIEEVGEAATGTSRTWRILAALGPGDRYLKVRLACMEPDRVLTVPLSPAPSVTVEIGAAGPGMPGLHLAGGGTVRLDTVTLSPFSCRAQIWRPDPAEDVSPLLFFLTREGTFLTLGQTAAQQSSYLYREDGTGSCLYRFERILDLSWLSAVVFDGTAYPLDGGEPYPVEVPSSLLPFRLPLMDRLSEDAGYSLSVQALCRALGASCVWDEDARTAVCTYRDTTISLTVGAGTALVDGQEVALQAPPALRDGDLAAGCQVFSDAWGLDCFCPFSPDGTSRDGWIVIP